LPQQKVSSAELAVGEPALQKILGYPRVTEVEYAARLLELKELGVDSIILGGRTVIGGTHIAGKGCVGLVVKAKARGRLCAVKVRRTDANRQDMRDEVRYHGIANGAGVGPRLLGHTSNFMLMEFAEGKSIIEWVRGDIQKKQAAAVARAVLEQCFALDRAGLDHGELAHLDRHVIVDGSGATIIDLESASTTRKISNVSSAGQSLLVSGAIAGALFKILPHDRDAAIDALKKYKRDSTRENLEAVLALAG
jgi:putative serine/threonine protein kinase